jgi:cell filamentation protein
VTFDPFGDFATEGYLRNVEKEKDLDIVKRLEHTSFTTGLDAAFAALGRSKEISYPNARASGRDHRISRLRPSIPRR